MKRGYIIVWSLVVLAAFALLALTVLNKAWWARRINARWNVSEVTPADSNAPAGFDKPTFTKVEFSAEKAKSYGLGELIRLYFKGLEHWSSK